MCHTPWCQYTIFGFEMILQVNSDASYMNKKKAHSTSSGHYFLSNNIKSGKPIVLNDAIHTLCKIIGVAASADEAEMGSLFWNTQETVKLKISLQELGPIHTVNTTATGIIYKTIKQQRSRAMNINYFWTISKQYDKTINVSWHPGRETLADYSSKHQSTTIHQNLRPKYLHMPN